MVPFNKKAKTLRVLLHEAVTELKRAGIEDALLSAEILMATAWNADRSFILREGDRSASAPEQKRFREFIAKRKLGCPVAYVIGEKEFFSLSFEVTSDVLIPRPETEFLVEEALRVVADQKWKQPRIVDVGTGSGIIAVTLKKKMSYAALTAIDKSEAALAVARRNAARHRTDIHFILGDLINLKNQKFDLICANLPYVPTADWEKLSREVRDFEPRIALDGGVDGVGMISRLLSEAPNYLAKEGKIILEIGDKQLESVKNLTTDRQFEIEKIRKDYQGIPRTVVLS